MKIITGIAHICFLVADLERSEKFYCGALGMEKAFDFVRDDGKRFGLYVYAGERTFVELFLGDVAPPAERQGFKHLCLEVASIDTAVRTLRERGVDVGDAKLGGDGTYQAWLKDPDGNRIELHGYTAESKQKPFLA